MGVKTKAITRSPPERRRGRRCLCSSSPEKHRDSVITSLRTRQEMKKRKENQLGPGLAGQTGVLSRLTGNVAWAIKKTHILVTKAKSPEGKKGSLTKPPLEFRPPWRGKETRDVRVDDCTGPCQFGLLLRISDLRSRSDSWRTQKVDRKEDESHIEARIDYFFVSEIGGQQGIKQRRLTLLMELPAVLDGKTRASFQEKTKRGETP